MKNKTMYELREYVGNRYSRSLSIKLRTWAQANKLKKRLLEKHPDIFLVRYEIKVPA